jgi:hypothetical protein
MRLFVTLAAFVALLNVALQNAGARSAQPPADGDSRSAFASLGPQPSVHVPDGLESLVGISHAAVLAEIVSFGSVRLEEQNPPASSPRRQPTVAGFATYRVLVQDVLFNALGDNARPIATGTELEVDARVGKREAEEFVGGRRRVERKDLCLLYLYYRPTTQRWALQPWMMQFRQTRDADRGAETVIRGSEARLLGTSFALVRRGESLVADWNSLVERTRTIGLRKQGPQVSPR